MGLTPHPHLPPLPSELGQGPWGRDSTPGRRERPGNWALQPGNPSRPQGSTGRFHPPPNPRLLQRLSRIWTIALTAGITKRQAAGSVPGTLHAPFHLLLGAVLRRAPLPPSQQRNRPGGAEEGAQVPQPATHGAGFPTRCSLPSACPSAALPFGLCMHLLHPAVGLWEAVGAGNWAGWNW